MSERPAAVPVAVASNGERSTGDRLGLLCAVLAALGFSMKSIFVKLGLAAGADALSLLSLRMAFALPVFLGLAWRAGARGMTRRDWLALLTLGVLGYYLASLFDFLGLQYISAGLERMILYIYPTIVVLLSAALLRERVPRRAWAAMALCYGGIALAMVHDVGTKGDTGALVRGASWVFASAVSYALYWVGSARVVKRVGSARLSAYASSFACAMCLGHYAVTRPVSALGALPSAAYIHGLALAVVSTVAPIWLQAEAIRRLGAGQSAVVGTLGPVLTLLLGWLFLGEPLSLAQLAGAALVVAGVGLSRAE